MGGQPAKSCDLLLHNCRVVTGHGRAELTGNGAVAISDQQFADVGPDDLLVSRYAAKECIDGHGALLHPGFIDAHIHISQYSARSVLPRMGNGRINMGHWKAAIRDEDERASVALAAIDYFRAGYTGFVDPGTIFNPDVAAQTAREAGIRIWLTDPYVGDRARRLAERLPELASEDFLVRWPRNTEEAIGRLGGQLRNNRQAAGLVHGFVGLYGEDTASDELYEAALAMAKSEGVQFQEHRGYSPSEYLASEERTGRPALDFLADRHLLGEHVTFVHMNIVREHEIAPLAASGTRIVWCPYGQLQMIGKGVAQPRMTDLWRAGLRIGLATDIPRSINFDALGGLAVANADATGKPLFSSDIFRMRTLAAAETVGAGSLTGSIEPGKRADLVLRTETDSQMLHADDLWESAVLGLSSPPRLVIVNGEIVLKDGIPTKVDPDRVSEQARNSVRSLLNRIGL